MDVEQESALEEGEVIDDEVYTPLERPLNKTINNIPRNETKTSDIESDWSSKSDTDSDDLTSQSKKPKVKLKTKTIKHVARRKKYDIWSSHVQEIVLAETLVSCDVSKIDRSRNVEAYNSFDLRHKLGNRHNNKRTYDQRKCKKVSLQSKDDSDDDDTKGSKRIISDLTTNVDSTDEDLAKDIANKLFEEKDDLMLKTVQIAGKIKAIEIFTETQRIEADGGMLIMNRTRRRTPGGVFIFLLKRDNDVTEEQQCQIFGDEKREQNRQRKLKQKARLKALKDKTGKKNSDEKLPSLLTRSELTIQKLSSIQDRNESESEEFVNNPPPSPVTDGKETSNDGMSEDLVTQPSRNLNSYEDEFLDLGTTIDMDMF